MMQALLSARDAAWAHGATECGFADDALNRRLLFLGLTRARVHLERVVSTRAERLLASSLG